MRNRLLLIVAAASLLGAAACTPARIAGNAAIGTGQLALGAADILI